MAKVTSQLIEKLYSKTTATMHDTPADTTITYLKLLLMAQISDRLSEIEQHLSEIESKLRGEY